MHRWLDTCIPYIHINDDALIPNQIDIRKRTTIKFTLSGLKNKKKTFGSDD